MGKVLRSQEVNFGKYTVPLALVDLFRLVDGDESCSREDLESGLRAVKDCLKNELIVYRPV